MSIRRTIDRLTSADNVGAINSLAKFTIQDGELTFVEGEDQQHTPLIIESMGRKICFPMVHIGIEDTALTTFSIAFSFNNANPTTRDSVYTLTGLIAQYDGLTLTSISSLPNGQGDLYTGFSYRKKPYLDGQIVWTAQSTYPAIASYYANFTFDLNTQYHPVLDVKVSNEPYGIGIKYKGFTYNNNGIGRPPSISWSRSEMGAIPEVGQVYYVTLKEYTRDAQQVRVQGNSRRVSLINVTSSPQTVYEISEPPANNASDIVYISTPAGISHTLTDQKIVYEFRWTNDNNGLTLLSTDLQGTTISEISEIFDLSDNVVLTNYSIWVDSYDGLTYLRWSGTTNYGHDLRLSKDSTDLVGVPQAESVYVNTSSDGSKIFLLNDDGSLPTFDSNDSSDSSIEWSSVPVPYLDTFVVKNVWTTDNYSIVGLFNLIKYENGIKYDFIRIKTIDGESDDKSVYKEFFNGVDMSDFTKIKITFTCNIPITGNIIKFYLKTKDSQGFVTTTLFDINITIGDQYSIGDSLTWVIDSGFPSDIDNVIEAGFKIIDATNSPQFDIYSISSDEAADTYIGAYYYKGKYYKVGADEEPVQGSLWSVADSQWTLLTETIAAEASGLSVAYFYFDLEPASANYGRVVIGNISAVARDSLKIIYNYEMTPSDAIAVSLDAYMRPQTHKDVDMPESVSQSYVYTKEYATNNYRRYDANALELTNGDAGDIILYGAVDKFQQVVIYLSSAPSIAPTFKYQYYATDSTGMETWKDISSTYISDIDWTVSDTQTLKFALPQEILNEWTTVAPYSDALGGVPLEGTDKVCYHTTDYTIGVPVYNELVQTHKLDSNDAAYLFGGTKQFDKISIKLENGMTAGSMIIEFSTNADKWQQTSNYIDGTNQLQSTGAINEIIITLTPSEKAAWNNGITYGTFTGFFMRIRMTDPTPPVSNFFDSYLYTLRSSLVQPLAWITSGHNNANSTLPAVPPLDQYLGNSTVSDDNIGDIESSTEIPIYLSSSIDNAIIGSKNRFSAVRVRVATSSYPSEDGGDTTVVPKINIYLSTGVAIKDHYPDDVAPWTSDMATYWTELNVDPLTNRVEFIDYSYAFSQTGYADIILQPRNSYWSNWNPSESADGKTQYMILITVNAALTNDSGIDKLHLMSDKTLDVVPVEAYYIRAIAQTSGNGIPVAGRVALTNEEYWRDLGLMQVKYVHPIHIQGSFNEYQVVGFTTDFLKTMYSVLYEMNEVEAQAEMFARNKYIGNKTGSELDILGEELNSSRFYAENDNDYRGRLEIELETVASTEDTLKSVVARALNISEDYISFMYWWEGGWILDPSSGVEKLYQQPVLETIHLEASGALWDGNKYRYPSMPQYIYDVYKLGWGNSSEKNPNSYGSSEPPFRVYRINRSDSHIGSELPRTTAYGTSPYSFDAWYITREDVSWVEDAGDRYIEFTKPVDTTQDIYIQYYTSYDQTLDDLNELKMTFQSPPIGGAYIYAGLDPIYVNDTPLTYTEIENLADDLKTTDNMEFSFIATEARSIAISTFMQLSLAATTTKPTVTLTLYDSIDGARGDSIYSQVFTTDKLEATLLFQRLDLWIDGYDYDSGVTVPLIVGNRYYVTLTCSDADTIFKGLDEDTLYAYIYLARKNQKEMTGISESISGSSYSTYDGVVKSKKPMTTFATMFFSLR